jgi:hypothetical protein
LTDSIIKYINMPERIDKTENKEAVKDERWEVMRFRN